jgi:hypothetical protein
LPRIVLDFDPAPEQPPEFEGDSSDLVYFLSWAFSARYGANHELSVASLVLRGEFKIDLRPLLTFADREAEEPADEEALERAWQDAEPLADCCAQATAALNSDDPKLRALQEDYPNLRANIAELERLARWAMQQDLRIRVTYVLDTFPR